MHILALPLLAMVSIIRLSSVPGRVKRSARIYPISNLTIKDGENSKIQLQLLLKQPWFNNFFGLFNQDNLWNIKKIHISFLFLSIYDKWINLFSKQYRQCMGIESLISKETCRSRVGSSNKENYDNYKRTLNKNYFIEHL